MARAPASGSARARGAIGAVVLAWALLLFAPAAGCGTDADRGRVLPAEDQLGDPEVHWRHQGERRGDEAAAPVEPPSPRRRRSGSRGREAACSPDLAGDVLR